MARIRYIKPEFFDDSKIGKLSVEARYIYIGLWCFMDRNGVTEASPSIIQKKLFLYDEKTTTKNISTYLLELEKAQRLIKFVYKGEDFYFCPHLGRHQKFHKFENPKYPIPEEILITLRQHPTSTSSAPTEHPNSSMGIGIGIGIGMGNHGSENSVEQVPSPRENLFSQLQIPWLAEIKTQVLEGWLQTYPDRSWIEDQLKQAHLWTLSNSRKAPRSDWARFANAWLARAWEKHRKGLPSSRGTKINTTPIKIEGLP